MPADTLTINLDPELSALFRRYQAHTRTTAEHYIGELLAKTRPTLQAMVEALDEADGDAQALGRLFGSKMAQLMPAQQTAQAEA